MWKTCTEEKFKVWNEADTQFDTVDDMVDSFMSIYTDCMTEAIPKKEVSREPDKLRIFVNYALKTPEYECLSNFNRITYCCHFSAYARGFVLFRTYESRSGDAEFGR